MSQQVIEQRSSSSSASSQRATPCQRGDAEMWFAQEPTVIESAKSLCGSCPVREACLAMALERAEPWGVWGGQLIEQGKVQAQKRRRGRPRKNAVVAA